MSTGKLQLQCGIERESNSQHHTARVSEKRILRIVEREPISQALALSAGAADCELFFANREPHDRSRASRGVVRSAVKIPDQKHAWVGVKEARA
jgi:hypothetical protein